MIRTPLLIAALLLPPLAQAVGQAEPARAMVRLRPGQTVRIRLQDGLRLEGRLVAVDTLPPELRFAEPLPPVPVAAIDSLWLRSHASGTGALVGSIVGGVGSFVFWAALCAALSEDRGGDCGSYFDGGWRVVILYSAAGAAGGALLGATVGSLIPRWRRIDRNRITFSVGPSRLGLAAVASVRF